MIDFRTYDVDYYEINSDGLRIVRCKDGPHVLNKDAEPKKPAYFGFKCPRHETNECSYLRIRGGPAYDGKRPSWIWNGSYDKPTLSPSINCLSHNPQNPAEKYAGCGWHG